MKKFEELTTEEKAALTDDQINTYIRYKMAEDGINETTDPGEFTIEMPYVKTQTWYQIKNTSLMFKSEKVVEKLLEMQPHRGMYDWDIGTGMKYAEKIDKEIEIVTMYDKNDLEEKGQELIEYNRKYIEWNDLKTRYNRYIENKNSTTRNIWNVISKARDEMASIDAIKTAYSEFTELADGNTEIAMKFLKKTYSETIINKALGIENDETTS